MSTAGSSSLIKGLKYKSDLLLLSSTNEYLHSNKMPLWHAQREFYIYYVTKILLPIACMGNPIFKNNINFLSLVLCQETFLWNAKFHLCVSSMHIVMYTMHRETVISKISLLVNLEKTNMNPPHTYTIYTRRSVNIHNLLLPQNTPFYLLGFVLGTEYSGSSRVICC